MQMPLQWKIQVNEYIPLPLIFKGYIIIIFACVILYFFNIPKIQKDKLKEFFKIK
jgi:hypothetical protein